jgi:signal transduction histidine kinase/FtsZ-binding cell division protein ZapB
MIKIAVSNFPPQPDESIAQLQARIAALELENAKLRSQLQDARSPVPVQGASLEAAHAALQIEVSEFRRREGFIRDQEQSAQRRVAELSKANEVLQASLQKLAEEPELEKFLGHLLTVCTERFSAAEAGLWRYENGIFRLFVSYEDAAIKMRSGMAHPGFSPEIAKNIRNQDVLTRLRKREIVADYEEDFETRPAYEQFRDYFKRRGIKSALKIPMFLADELRGILVLRFADRHSFNPEEAELAHALANHAVLAMELTRLAEEAQQAAIAQEKENAAKAQAVELARTHQLLRNSLRYLSSTPDLSDVLGHLLVEVVQHAKAVVGHIFFYDAATATLSLGVRCREEQAFWVAAEDEPALFRSPISVARTPIFTALCQQPRLAILRQAQFETGLWTGVAEWFQAKGYQSTSSCVLMIGDQPLGLLAMAFAEQIMLRPVDEELILALAHQMALVIRLTHLADEAKQSALLQERNRLAGEIHDTLAQAFTAISIQLGVAKRIAQHEPDEVAQILDRVMELTNTALSKARRSVWALHPTAEEFADLATKLSQCVEQMTQGTAIQFQMEIEGTPRSLPPLVGKNLLRIGQEAITNTLKHAQATQLQVKLTYETQSVSLCVQDNGRGFLFPSDTGGFGLISLSERADRINGHLTIQSQLGQGTHICIQVPVESL